jgi:hypothetical protein
VKPTSTLLKSPSDPGDLVYRGRSVRCRGNIVHVTLLKPVTLSVFLIALVAGSVHAQTPPSARPEAGPSPLSEIAHDFSTWLNHVTGTRPKHHRAASSPPLPRPRPAELTRAAAVPNQDPAELARALTAPKKKATAPVLIND